MLWFIEIPINSINYIPLAGLEFNIDLLTCKLHLEFPDFVTGTLQTILIENGLKLEYL